MRHTVHKWFWVWNFDKEEKWLNEMAAKGLSLVSVGFCKYEFEDSMPGEHRVCLQFLNKPPHHPESRKYIEFLESTGAEHIGTFKRWVYFRKKVDGGEFALFSDNSSHIKHLSKVIGFVIFITALNLFVGTHNILIANRLSSPLNYLGTLNLIICLFGIWGILRLMKKRKKLKQESQLFE